MNQNKVFYFIIYINNFKGDDANESLDASEKLADNNTKVD